MTRARRLAIDGEIEISRIERYVAGGGEEQLSFFPVYLGKANIFRRVVFQTLFRVVIGCLRHLAVVFSTTRSKQIAHMATETANTVGVCALNSNSLITCLVKSSFDFCPTLEMKTKDKEKEAALT